MEIVKNVLLLSEIFPPVKGGSGRWFWEVYSRIQQDDVVIAAGQNSLASEFDQVSPLKTYRLPLASSCWGLKSLTGLKFYWRIFRLVRQIVKQENIEVIHCGRCLPEGFIGYLINKTMGIPYICFIHGEDVETAATSRELSWIVRKALNGAEYLVCNSQNTATILLNTWNSESSKTKVINPGVDTKRFVPADHDPETRAALGWNERPVILTVGRLQERKGHDMMIKALPVLKEQFPDILYAIIGGGEQRPILDNLVDKLGLTENVLFMSEVSDEQMIQCYQQCNLFILPNRTVGRDIEGFGMVLVEAQACGKPVIAGDSGGTSETMLIGESGYIVDCTSVPAMVEHILPILKDPILANNMGKKGCAHANAKLDWQALSLQAKWLFEKI